MYDLRHPGIDFARAQRHSIEDQTGETDPLTIGTQHACTACGEDTNGVWL